MSGNVWDRCEDTHYTICGGGYYFPVGYCAVDDYRPDSPDRSYGIGFRLARNLGN